MKKTKNYAMPYPEQDDYFNVEDFQDMMVSVDDLMKKLSDSGAQISSDAEHLYNQTKAQMDNIQKRMNAFTALRDGSTTGDAELKDIRVAYDGKEYGNAGEAVREQASDIHKALFGVGASIWSKAKSESTKYVAETKGICILNERFTAAGVVTKISRGTFAENESTLNLDRECSAYIVEFEKNPGTVYMPSAETIKIVSTTKIIFEANGNARCWIPVEKGQYLAVDSTATAYTSESNHVPYMLYDQANKTLECRGFGSTGSIEPVDPYSLALEYKLEYDMDDTGLVKQIDANREDAASLKEDLNNYAKSAFRYIPTTENNKFCRFDTGKIQSYEGKSVCSRIPVTELENVEIYSNNNVYSICFFNDETFISGSSPSSKSFSIPANCNNVIISFDGLDTNIVLVYRSKIDDYIVNTQVLPTYEFSVKTTKNFMRWDDGRIVFSNDFMMTQPFIVEPSKEYYVTGAITLAACFLNGSTFVSGTALNGIDHFTILEGCNRCVVDFNIITDLPTIMVRDPLLRNTSLCYGKVLGCLGDSITQGAGNNNHSWVDKMQSMCGFKSVYNYGVSGDTIEKMHDRIDAMESTLDYITLLGGTNNALWSNSQSIVDFKASFDSLVSSIIEKYPTSKVLGIIPPKYNYSSGDVTRNWNVPTSPNNLKLIDFVNAEIEIYSKYSVPIVNLFSYCNIQPDINAQKIGLMPDGVHPNQKGYFDFIAPKIAEALKSI